MVYWFGHVERMNTVGRNKYTVEICTKTEERHFEEGNRNDRQSWSTGTVDLWKQEAPKAQPHHITFTLRLTPETRWDLHWEM